jgi:hypothetical protein
MRATYPANLILVDFITIIIFVDEAPYYTISSSLPPIRPS